MTTNSQPARPRKRRLGLALAALLCAPAAAQQATFSNFGAGCPDANGLTMQVHATPPVLGDTYTIVFTNRPNPIVAAVLGLSSSVGLNVVGNPNLPYDLSAIGMPGCALLVSADLAIEFLSNGAWSILIPNDPSLTGVPLNVQGAVEAPGANAVGVVMSNAGLGVVGTL